MNKLPIALFALTIIMILISLKDAHRTPGFEAGYGVLGVIFFFVITRALSYVNQREGLVDD